MITRLSKALRSSETSVALYRGTRRNFTEDLNLQQRVFEDLKSRSII